QIVGRACVEGNLTGFVVETRDGFPAPRVGRDRVRREDRERQTGGRRVGKDPDLGGTGRRGDIEIPESGRVGTGIRVGIGQVRDERGRRRTGAPGHWLLAGLPVEEPGDLDGAVLSYLDLVQFAVGPGVRGADAGQE